MEEVELLVDAASRLSEPFLLVTVVIWFTLNVDSLLYTS
jgi:hypothetical protein